MTLSSLPLAVVHALLKSYNSKAHRFFFITFNFRSLSLITYLSITIATARCSWRYRWQPKACDYSAKIKRRRGTEKKASSFFQEAFRPREGISFQRRNYIPDEIHRASMVPCFGCQTNARASRCLDFVVLRCCESSVTELTVFCGLLLNLLI